MYAASLIYSKTIVKYFQRGREFKPTPEQKLLWEITEKPIDVTIERVVDKVLLDTIYGKSKKEISRIADNNLLIGKYSQVGYLGFGEADVTLIFK